LVLTQRGNRAHLMVTDDGRGIDVEEVRQRAVELGLVSPSAAATLDQHDIFELLMQPGMSTRDAVSEISGRGVGLDVVRQRVEELQGQVYVQSKSGQGTTFEIVLPISLSTLHCVLVAVGPEVYAIPSASVVRVIDYEPEKVFTVKGQLTLALDGQPLPLVTLADVLERNSTDADSAERFAVCLASADRRCLFLVDDILADQEVVVRNLTPEFARIRNVSGATLLANGEVVLILNVGDLIKSAQGKAIRRRQVAPPAPVSTGARRILVVDDSITTRTLQKNILEAAGYEVETATHGLEALEKLNTLQIDLMIADIQMPWLDGFELTAQVRKHPRLANLPIILVTSMDSQENKERGFRAGADAYIVKGVFDQNELLKTIRSLL
jgi:two-component system chemotaxis sensor kinase CheA